MDPVLDLRGIVATFLTSANAQRAQERELNDAQSGDTIRNSRFLDPSSGRLLKIRKETDTKCLGVSSQIYATPLLTPETHLDTCSIPKRYVCRSSLNSAWCVYDTAVFRGEGVGFQEGWRQLRAA